MKRIKIKRLLFILTALLVAVLNSKGQVHWESLVLESDNFQFTIPSVEPGADWIQLNYDDSQWDTGSGGFGYGDNDDNTIIPAGSLSAYFRKSIYVPASMTFQKLLLDIDYDDAFVAYLNGVEVARSGNLVAGTPALQGSVTVDHEARMYSGSLPEQFALDPDILKEGDTVRVKVIEIDGRGRIRLSRKAVLAEEE